MQFISVSQEAFEALWPAVEELTTLHAKEVEPPGPRQIKVDAARMAQADRAGLIRCFSLRVDGVLWGYCSWNLTMDLESEGLKIATQGAWFVKEGAPWGSAVKLFVESLKHLREIGIQCAFPHHRMQGRGAKIGRFFRKLGAIPIQETYMLWLEEK